MSQQSRNDELRANLTKFWKQYPNADKGFIKEKAIKETFHPQASLGRPPLQNQSMRVNPLGGGPQLVFKDEPQESKPAEAKLQVKPEEKKIPTKFPSAPRLRSRRLRGKGVEDLIPGVKAVKTVGKAISSIAEKIAPRSMPKKVATFTNAHKDWKIIGIKVCRVPIIPIIEKVIRQFPGVDAELKKRGIDILYHLYMTMTLEHPSGAQKEIKFSHGSKAPRVKPVKIPQRDGIRLERNQVFQISPEQPGDNLPEGKGAACINIPAPRPEITFGTAMANFVKEATARSKEYGPWRYHPFLNNCQDALLSFLKGMGKLTPQAQSFIKQQTDNLVSKTLARVGSTITDIAGGVTNAIGGGCACKDNPKATSFEDILA